MTISRDTDHQVCGMSLAIDVVGGKWRMHLMWVLGAEPQRFGQIRRTLAGVSEKVLPAVSTDASSTTAGGAESAIEKVNARQMFCVASAGSTVEYTQKIKKYDTEKGEIQAEAKRFEQIRNDAQRHSQIFGIAVIYLQIEVTCRLLGHNQWFLSSCQR